MDSWTVICPICGKHTLLRIQNGGYLEEYPIRVNCMNCRALLKGLYVMAGEKPRGLKMFNADFEKSDVETSTHVFSWMGDPIRFRNVDYVAEISGELPCRHVYKYSGGIPTSPFLRSTDYVDIEERIERLKHFNENMKDWNRTKSTAFQLLDEGSFDHIPKALNEKIGKYKYTCDHYLKTLHCLQEVVTEETEYLFLSPSKDACIAQLLQRLSQIDNAKLIQFVNDFGGKEELVKAYRRAIAIISSFMAIYPNVLPAETCMRYKVQSPSDNCIATCSFQDIKIFYQDAYESLLSLFFFPVGLDNYFLRGDFNIFSPSFADVNNKKGIKSIADYRKLDNGTKVNKKNDSEQFQGMIGTHTDRLLRNGIGHNNYLFDGITQEITYYNPKKPNAPIHKSLMEMAEDCIRLTLSAVILSEIILFFLREVFRQENITTIIHPQLYKGIKVNDKCPCGSGKKYKDCCRIAFEEISRKG